MSSMSPYQIAIPAEKLQRLSQKLSLSDFPSDASARSPWSRGPPLSEIKRLVSHWQHSFDWRKEEAKLNEFPQYITPIDVDGFGTPNVHFIHKPSKNKSAIPLLFVHGWPGGFFEVGKILERLVEGTGEKRAEEVAFHVVAPSLVGFGFSDGSENESFGINQHAEVCHKLMQTLGYTEYVVQGGDIGYLVARSLAINYGPEYCKACHLNSTAPAEPNDIDHVELHTQVQQTPLSHDELAGLGRTADFSQEGNGFYKIQSTRPQTIAYSLADSPVGLLAWIYDKLHSWTDDYPWTDNEILMWVSIYYFSTAGPGAPNNLYYNMEHSDPVAFTAAQVYADVPLGVARFPKEMILLPKLWNRTLGPVIFESEHSRGGHFAAWEQPDAIVADLKTMFGRSGGAYGCVTGRSGYGGVSE